MLLDAARILGLDCRQSFLIGDSWKDMEAGKAAGCRTILLRRRYNGNCGRRLRSGQFDRSSRPDYEVGVARNVWSQEFRNVLCGKLFGRSASGR